MGGGVEKTAPRSFGALAMTHDLAEGTKAFLEKRPPQFDQS
jgi:1,4-dihydroxy-2-naphthoyl-CoA synthase